MSFRSLTMDEEAVTTFEMSLAGTDVAGETMEAESLTSGVVALEEDKEEEGFDGEGLGTVAVCS